MRDAALVLFAMTTLAVAVGVPSLPSVHAQEPPSDCTVESALEAKTFTCVWDWTFETGGGPAMRWQMPPDMGTTIVELNITTDSPTQYLWGFCIEPQPPMYCPLTGGERPDSPTAKSQIVRTSLVEFDPNLGYHFMINTITFPLAPAAAHATFHVEGRFDNVTQNLPSGGHAGSPMDPQLRDALDDASTRATDIAGGWLDQPFLDDGLFEIGLMLPHVNELNPGSNDLYTFAFSFDVLGQPYTMTWTAQTATGPGEADDGWLAELSSVYGPALHPIKLPYRIDAANGTIRAMVPLRSVGDPHPGDRFMNFTATSGHSTIVEGVTGFGPIEPVNPTADDLGNIPVRPFTTGGPGFWDSLAGKSETPPAFRESVSWYRDPFSPSSLPATLALGGIVVIAGAGTAVSLLLRRRVKRQEAMMALVKPAYGAVVKPGANILGKYRVERSLGTGGGGHAFLAHDVRMNRKVVLKTISGGDQTAAIREARAAAAIEHPNVVRVFDVEDLGPGALIVMEYVDGGSLKERIATGGALAEGAFAAVADDLLSSLEAVHAAGAVHRDIKPGNVLLTRSGRAKLSDFGIAHMVGVDATLGNAPSGSVQYMAPEQARGKRVTALSDLYSAAATLYEAHTGRPLVESVVGETPMEMQLRIGSAKPIQPKAAHPTLQAWFRRALAAKPEARFANASAMRQALTRALKAGNVVAR